MIHDNGGAPTYTRADERADLEKRIVGAVMWSPEHGRLISSILGTTGAHFVGPGHAMAYEIAIELGDEVSAFGVYSRLRSRSVALADAIRISSDYFDLAKMLTPDGARGLARALLRIHETTRAIAYCSEITDAIHAGAEVAGSLDALLEALDRARGARDEIRPWTLAEIRSTPPSRPGPILGDGVFSRGDWMLVHARENVGKTWALLELALALATGRPWYGIPTHRRHRVGIVTLEMGIWHVLQRLQVVWDGTIDLEHEDQVREIEEAIHVVCKDQVGFVDLSDPIRQRWLCGWLQERRIDVVLLDPLSHFLARDEDREGLAPILRFLEGLHGLCGCSAVLSHHDRKSSTQGDQGDHGSSARGSSTIMASARASFRLVAKRDDAGAPIELHCDKASNGPKPDPIWLRNDPTTGRLVVTSSPGAKRDATVQAILDTLAEGPMSTQQLADALASRASKRTIERHLKTLAKEGILGESSIKNPSGMWGSLWTLLDGKTEHATLATLATKGSVASSQTTGQKLATLATLATNEPVASGNDWEETF